MDQPNSSTADHDLLIRLDTKVENLTKAIEELNKNTIARLAAVEDGKADKEELTQAVYDLKALIKEEKVARETADADFEKRTRAVERFVYISMGVAIIVQLVILPIIIKFITA